MDLYVERQCIDQMKAGENKQFLLLLDAYFFDLYKYVARRVGEGDAAEKIVRLVFLDALGQIQNTPTDSGYVVWLYSLARPRVNDYIERNGFPEIQGVISSDEKIAEGGDQGEVLAKSEKMFGKLSMEEREILRLKFFEEVADGDVMTVLGIEEGTIGPRIYRVLKRAHFLLFGESDERQGVYFGELSGFLARMRELEDITIPEAFRLSFKADISARVERRDFAIEAEEPLAPKRPPVDIKDQPIGSNDPAKIFVEAVKEMRQEEAEERLREQAKLDKQEAIFDFIDKWKILFISGPVVLVVLIVSFIAFNFANNGKQGLVVERGYPTECGVEVSFDGAFSDGEMRSINSGISDKVCGNFEVSRLKIAKLDDGKVVVDVDVPNWFLEYGFVKKSQDWRIKKYERTPAGDKKSGKV